MKPRSSFFKKIDKINKAQNFNIRNERVDITTEFVDILDIKRICLPMQEMQVQSLVQEDSLGEGNGNLLQYSCLGNPMDQAASQAIIHGSQRVGYG